MTAVCNVLLIIMKTFVTCLVSVPGTHHVCPGERKRDYKKILQAVVLLLPEEPAVECLVLDFEVATWRGVHQIIDCFFVWQHTGTYKILSTGCS